MIRVQPGLLICKEFIEPDGGDIWFIELTGHYQRARIHIP